MIYTFTPNPAIDLFLEVDELLLDGDITRVRSKHQLLGGKGFNVSRILHQFQTKQRAYTIGGIDNRSELEALLAKLSYAHEVLWIDGKTRTNYHIKERHGHRSIKVNEQGELGAIDLEDLVGFLDAVPEPMDYLALCGSVPSGYSERLYADLTERFPDAKVIIDVAGVHLANALPAKPWLIKPNVKEVEETVGRPLKSMTELRNAAAELRQRGAQNVLITNGGGEGLFMGPGEAFTFRPPAIKPVRTVAAGDTFLGAFLAVYTKSQSMKDAISYGLAMSAAHCEGYPVERLKERTEALLPSVLIP